METLAWDILARDRMSDVLDKLARASDKLERSLNKTGNEAQQMGRKLDQAQPHTVKLHGGLEKLSNGAMQTIGWLRNLAVTAGMAFAAASAAGLAFGLKTAASNETARVSFDLLLGSAEKSKAFLVSLQDFAAKTPFDMPTLRDAASRLLAVGVNAKDVIPLMTRLGDATAGMGTGAEGIQRAVYALQQMRQSGKVQLDDINQLTDAGIPALDALAAHFHTTVAKVRDNISAGKVKADDLFAAIEHGEGPAFARLKGMMDRQSVTLAGVWSTFKDNASQALAGFVEPAMPAIKRGLDWLSAQVPKVLSGLRGLAKGLGETFKGSDVPQRLLDALRDLGEKFVPFLRKELSSLLKTIKDNREGLEKFGRFIADVVVPVVGSLLAGAIKILSGALQGSIALIAAMGNAWEKARGPIGTFAKFLLGVLVGSFAATLTAASIAFGWIPGLGPKLESAKKEMEKFVNKVNNLIDNITSRKDIYVITHYGSVDMNQRSGERSSSGRASGGPMPAAGGAFLPDVVRVGENGPEEMYRSAGGWRVRPNNQLTAPAGGNDILGTLEVVHRTPGGEELRRELVTLRRRRGYRTYDQMVPATG